MVHHARKQWDKVWRRRVLGTMLCVLLCLSGTGNVWGQKAAEDENAERAVVEAVTISGNKRTKTKVITRNLTFAVTQEISLEDMETLIERNENNIYNTGLFNVVEMTYEKGEGTIRFHIEVVERWYIWPIPYLSLEERTFNEWWEDKDLDRLVYGLGVEWQNFTGWNDRLYLYAQNGYSRRINAQLRRPFIFGGPLTDALFSYSYLSNREIGYATEGGYLQLARLQNAQIRNNHSGSVLFSHRLTPRRQIQLSFGYQHFTLHDSIRHFNPLYLTDNNLVEQYPFIGLAFVNDQRDLFSFPLKGHKLSFSARKLGLFGWGTSDFAKLTASWSHHIPLEKRWNFAYGMQSFLLLGKEVPYYDKYFVGFGSFLRGYENFVIDGSFINLLKFEWK
ncbi:MAG: BamA/TamA family outer membrane protein, partial [Bacteroidota bacterium]